VEVLSLRKGAARERDQGLHNNSLMNLKERPECGGDSGSVSLMGTGSGLLQIVHSCCGGVKAKSGQSFQNAIFTADFLQAACAFN
jgi:hypothetical protein